MPKAGLGNSGDGTPTGQRTTLQARFGFKDPELTTPRHDEIMLWLDTAMANLVEEWLGDEAKVRWDKSAQNAREVLKKELADDIRSAQNGLNRTEDALNSYGRGPVREIYCKEKMDFEKKLERLNAVVIPVVPDPAKIKIEKIWEFPVMTGRDNNYMVGFVDMKADVSMPVVVPEEEDFSFGVGYQINMRSTLYFEVKPSIGSLGEVIRQVRMYQQYLRGKFYIVCPDDRFRGPLESQGIGFVKCP